MQLYIRNQIEDTQATRHAQADQYIHKMCNLLASAYRANHLLYMCRKKLNMKLDCGMHF